jgi:hypothetical protein
MLALSIVLEQLADSNESPLKRAVLSTGLAEDMEIYISDGIAQPYLMMIFRGIADGDETEKKILDDFDGTGAPKDEDILGERRYQVMRSVPGRIISQGIAASLDDYFVSSLQRRARIFTEVSVNDEVEVLRARALMVEALPDSAVQIETLEAPSLSLSPRTVLSRIGLRGAEPKRSAPLRFACRCSPERAAAMLSAMDDSERSTLPEKIDITCHMCGRTFTLATGSGGFGR